MLNAERNFVTLVILVWLLFWFISLFHSVFLFIVIWLGQLRGDHHHLWNWFKFLSRSLFYSDEEMKSAVNCCCFCRNIFFITFYFITWRTVLNFGFNGMRCGMRIIMNTRLFHEEPFILFHLLNIEHWTYCFFSTLMSFEGLVRYLPLSVVVKWIPSKIF